MIKICLSHEYLKNRTKQEEIMKMRLLFCNVLVLTLICCVSVFAQTLPDASMTDPTGDVSLPAVDYTACYFVQQGESLFVGITMDGVIKDRLPVGYSTNTFFVDVDDNTSTGQAGSKVGSENNLTFCDWGDGNWYGNFYMNWDADPAINAFTDHPLIPVTFSADGKTMFVKFSLVGAGWEEVVYDLNGWYKDGTSWHQVPHLPGDLIETAGLCTIDINEITALVDKEGTNCIIKIPEPYSATADAKNIAGVVDEMVGLVRSEIGTISDATKKFAVEYENVADYASPKYFSTAFANQFGCRIPGQDWVDTPNWFAMLDGVISQSLFELSPGMREIFIAQQGYQRPVCGSGEGWYSTVDDSINGFKWASVHKMTARALLGIAYENCYAFYVAESMTDGEAKTAISAKKTELINAWTAFNGTAKDLTPELMTGLLLSLSTDLSWTADVYKEIIPTTFATTDSTNNFTQVVNNYIRNAKYSISSSDDFNTQAHHTWYGVITAVQAAAIELAMGENLYAELDGITDFPIDQTVFTDVKKLLNPIQEKYTFDDTVPYVWNDIVSIGTELTRNQFASQWTTPDLDDGGAGPIALGMSFSFYDEVYDSITIGINGICSFTDPVDWITSGSYGTTIPGMGWDNILCPIACDIMGEKAYTNAPYKNATGKIYYYYNSTAGTFTVQYQHMTNHHYVVDETCPDTTLTFQIVLDSNDGSITYYYKDLGIAPEPTAKRATIGIQPGKDSGLGVQYYGNSLPANGYPVTGDAIKFYVPSTAIKNVPVSRPTAYSLAQNFPNPFNPTTSIAFTLPARANVSLAVYDMLGRNVANLVNNKSIESGYHRVQWDASHLPSGIYFYRLEVTGQSSLTKKCILMK